MSTLKRRLDSLLISLGIRKRSAQSIYCSFVLGEIRAEGVYSYLGQKEAREFVLLHNEVKVAVEIGGGRLPSEVLMQLGGLLVANPRRFGCILAQIDSVIDRDTKGNIFKTEKVEVH